MTFDSGPDRVPEPQAPRRKHASATLRVLGSLLAVLILAGIIGGGAGYYGYTLYTAPGPLQNTTVYMIDKGLKPAEIAARLADPVDLRLGVLTALIVAARTTITLAHAGWRRAIEAIETPRGGRLSSWPW